jgi:hypothetical protein
MWWAKSTINKKSKKLLQKLQSPKGDYFNFSQIERYFKKSNALDFRQIISDKTSNDLDLEEVFMYLDRTVSKVGQQYLYHSIRTLPKDNQRNTVQEQLIGALSKDPALVSKIILQLSRLNSSDVFGISNLFQDQQVAKPSWFWVIQLLFSCSILCLILSIFMPWMVIVLLVFFTANSFIHFWNKGNTFQYAASIPQLIILNNVSRALSKHPVLTIGNEEIHQSISDVQRICRKMSLFKLEASLKDDMTSIADSALELVKMLFILEPIFLFRGIKKIKAKQQQIHHIFTFVGQIDSALSISALRNSIPNYCIPKISEQQNIVGTDLYHPLIEDCCKNSIEISNKSILLTGSNMSGKTTFIRIIGINTLLAQTINTSFSTQFSIPKLNIHSAVRISDDLLSSKSYYFEEVTTIKEMIGECQDGVHNLFLLDEIFKGTNTNERIAAGKAVLSHLNRNNFVFVSTHDLELTNLLADEYEMYHFTEAIDADQIVFDYKLKRGKLQFTNALKILRINDYPDDIVNEAESIASRLKNIQQPL